MFRIARNGRLRNFLYFVEEVRTTTFANNMGVHFGAVVAAAGIHIRNSSRKQQAILQQ